jgi:hypothetical protein
MTIYLRTRDEHWLWDKQDQGMGLILEDNSLWEVHPSDRSLTSRWLRGSTMFVEETMKEGYRYVLRNRTEGEMARVNFLGDFRAVG